MSWKEKFEEIEKRFGIVWDKEIFEPEKEFISINGNNQVLISAPHATIQGYRAGKEQDDWTGAIAIYLAEVTRSSCIFMNSKSSDKGFNLYKVTIEKIIKRKGIKLFLDLHGCVSNYCFALDIGTMFGKSLHGQWVLDLELVRILKKYGFGDKKNPDLFISHNAFNAGSPLKEARDKTYILTKWVSQRLQIPAIQIEINKKLRGEDEELTERFIQAMEEYIQWINAACPA